MAEKMMKNLFRGVSVPFVSPESVSQEIDLLAMYKRKAMDSRKLADTFSYAKNILKFVTRCGGIKAISKSAWQRTNGKVWSQFQSDLFTWILMMVYHKQEYEGKSWSLIFYEYMKDGKADRHNILTPSIVASIYELLSATMDCLPPDLREAAEEMFRFFECHQIDPYSCVISQEPSKEILKFSLTISDTALADSMNYELFGATDPKGKINYTKRYEELISRIVVWSTVPQESALQHLNQLASSIRGVGRLPRGSLVLVRVGNNDTEKTTSLEDDKWVYGRIAGKAEGSLVLLYLTPEESLVVSFEVDKVIPVAPEMCKKYFGEDNFSCLEKAVTTNIDKTYFKIVSYCAAKAKEVLKKGGVENEVIELAFKNMCVLPHYEQLQKAVTLLNKPCPDALMREMKTYVDNLVQKSIQETKSCPMYHNFQPTHEQSVQQLQNFDSAKVFQQELKQYLGVCELSIERLELRKHKILNGTRKKELSDGWLKKIEGSVTSFLVKHGFETDAVPKRYLDEPPTSISAVRRNLVLMRRILTSYNSSQDIFKLKPLIDNLCKSTYTTIDRFILDIDYCVALTLNKPIQSIPKNLGPLRDLITNSNLSEELKRQLLDCIEDKAYLLKMKKMEYDSNFASSQRMVTIPVSGLAMSKLCRVENEHKSVLDLWEPARISTVQGDNRTPLEVAVMKNDTKQVEQLLKSGSVYVNEPDGNGWTALHLACSYMMNLPRLETIEILLNFQETTKTLINNYGNTALHYYSHIPVTENIRTKYRDIFLKLIEDPKIIHIQNHAGETPLHRAALSANPVAARYLLENGADPNFANEDGSTAFHYAVQSASKECVETLMKFHGNHTQSNIAGESPLDVAIKLNLTDLIELLSKANWGVDQAKAAQKHAGHRQRQNVSRIDRRTIYQQANVPDQILDLVKLEQVNRPAQVGGWKKSAPPPEVLAALQESSGTSDVENTSWKKSTPPPEVLAALQDVKEESTPKTSNWKKRIQKIGSDINSSTRKLVEKTASEPTEKIIKEDKPSTSSNKNLISELSNKTLRPVATKESSPIKRRPQSLTTQKIDPNTNASLTTTSPLRNRTQAISKPESMDEYRIALWDVTAEAADEISFKKGDRIKVTAKDPSGWWTGEVNGKLGNFPSNYTAPEEATTSPNRSVSPNSKPSQNSAVPKNVTQLNRTESQPQIRNPGRGRGQLQRGGQRLSANLSGGGRGGRRKLPEAPGNNANPGPGSRNGSPSRGRPLPVPK